MSQCTRAHQWVRLSVCVLFIKNKTWHTNRHSAGGRWAWGRTCGFSITTIIWLTHCLVELCPKVWFSCTGKLNRAWCGTHAAPNPFPAARLLFVFSAQRFPRVQCFHAPPLRQCVRCGGCKTGEWLVVGVPLCKVCTEHWGLHTEKRGDRSLHLFEGWWLKKNWGEGESEDRYTSWNSRNRVRKIDQIKHYEKTRWW